MFVVVQGDTISSMSALSLLGPFAVESRATVQPLLSGSGGGIDFLDCRTEDIGRWT